ncbi:ABC transporter permease [Reinekea marinisedimentorum]|uniref:ABC-type multidrug transport system permease subunit n=1 Tax=Reinekea marinisedimentorum TaxID=230495 RepID=A0A4V2UJ54_9GAMM|nr:ABC transporter permease [Reinekea marinisedimentorum]TCS38740.1 ABC-type multidrug transport system permease subunit [Reinekea marinisedimentorum]
MSGFTAGLKREWLRLISQPTYWAALFLLPMVCFVLLAGIYSVPTVYEVPMDVVDLDGSSSSRDTIFNINASPKVDLRQVLNTTEEAIARVKSHETFGFMILPEGLERKLSTGEQIEINAYVNEQSLMLGNVLSGEVLGGVIRSSLSQSVVSLMAAGQSYDQALANVIPIATTSAKLGNSYLNYQSFLLATLLPHIWHIMVMTVSIIVFGKELKDGTIADWYETSEKHFLTAIFSKMLIPTVVLALWLIAIDVYVFALLDAHAYASLGALIVSGLLTQLCYMAIGMSFAALFSSYRMSLSMGAFFTTPAYSFVGITYPTFNMDWFSQTWRAFLPVTHLYEAQNAILHWQAKLVDVVPYLLPLAGFTLVYSLLALLALKKRIYNKALWYQH